MEARDFIYCTIFGVRHRLFVTKIDFSQTPIMHTVDQHDFLCVLPKIIVGAAYDTYTPYKVLKAGNADFRIKRIERLTLNTWRYTFIDTDGALFSVVLTRRSYGDRPDKGSVFKRQGTKRI